MVLLVRADDSRRAMPTVRLREIGAAVTELADLGIQAVKVFASGDSRDRTGSRGKTPDSLMARVIREVKAANPSALVMTETCLCSYTDSGECHLMDRMAVWIGAEQAVAQADQIITCAAADIARSLRETVARICRRIASAPCSIQRRDLRRELQPIAERHRIRAYRH